MVWSVCLFACGRAVLLLFFVPNFRRRRKLGTKSESLPRGRRRQRRGGGTTAYVLLLIGLTRSRGQLVFSPAAERYFFLFFPPNFRLRRKFGGKKSLFHAAAGAKDVWFTQPRKSCYLQSDTTQGDRFLGCQRLFQFVQRIWRHSILA